jgi:cytochrome c oxidase assembly protein subunit 15
MSLEEFKAIFWWEWAHRFFGRFIGVAFLFPFLFFLTTGRVEKSLQPKLWALFALGGLQGFVGWYMVASGLTERTDVSQYRLAMHLGLAVFIFAAIIWVVLDLIAKSQTNRYLTAAPKGVGRVALSLVLLIYIQIIAGAFVAGMKAGFAYNSWPLMNGKFIPSGLDAMSPFWRNLFENALTVQFNHRMIAYLVIIAVLAHLLQCLLKGKGEYIASGSLLLLATFGQVVIGIITLLKAVPLDMALMHQGGALVLLTAAIWHAHRLRYEAV